MKAQRPRPPRRILVAPLVNTAIEVLFKRVLARLDDFGNTDCRQWGKSWQSANGSFERSIHFLMRRRAVIRTHSMLGTLIQEHNGAPRSSALLIGTTLWRLRQGDTQRPSVALKVGAAQT